ncbi:MAG: hypothetical protein WC506_06665 [Candidatus Micrarchaeia archaeon]
MKNFIIAILVGMLLIFGCTGTGNTQQAASQHASSMAPNAATGAGTQAGAGSQGLPAPNAVKLSDEPYAPYALQIAPGGLSDAAKRAMSGFGISQEQQADGSILVNLTVARTGQTSQVSLKPGYSLYIIETSYGDDPQPNGETSFGDDSFVIVDPSGYVVPG